jgi:hypothetical protein
MAMAPDQFVRRLLGLGYDAPDPTFQFSSSSLASLSPLRFLGSPASYRKIAYEGFRPWVNEIAPRLY